MDSAINATEMGQKVDKLGPNLPLTLTLLGFRPNFGPYSPSERAAACAAESRAIGTLNGEQDT